ncbi:FAD-dependent oxidoreductase [Paenibacillus puldeungensis]|uniref:FAD-dependent oxidoreductase n=1 Tax=Paenibacillus puldeungensis TaxID=696536 RepID=A0ABW3RZV4_9BACL
MWWKNKRPFMVIIAAALLMQLIHFAAFTPGAYAGTPQKSTPLYCGPGCSHYDVVVIGSEIEGVELAKAAHDQGLSVLILDPRSKPGGELIQGQMLVLDEPHDKAKRSLVQGEIKHLYDGYKSGVIRRIKDFRQYYQRLIRGIPLKSGVAIDSIRTIPGGNEKSLEALSYRANDGSKYTVQAEYWVENTDYGALSSKLGEERIPGMESIYRGSKPDYMAATYMLNFNNVDWAHMHEAVLHAYPLSKVQKIFGQNTYVDRKFATGFSNQTYKFRPKDSQLLLRGINATNQKNGQVIVNSLLIFNVNPADPKSVQTAISKAREEAPRILKFLQQYVPGFENAELGEFPEYLYIRDFNRYETKYVLDYKDVKSNRMFWDNVTIGGYTIDLQATQVMPLGVSLGKPNRYGIPLRSFELKSYDNVLVAGKNVGASIKAYGSARIIPTTALAGQTIGIILGREWKNGHKMLDQLTQADFVRIHNYLAKDFNIVLNR